MIVALASARDQPQRKAIQADADVYEDTKSATAGEGFGVFKQVDLGFPMGSAVIQERRLGSRPFLGGVHIAHKKWKADSKVKDLETRIKAIKNSVTAGDFAQVGELKSMKQDLLDARKEQKRSEDLVQTLEGYIKSIRKSVKNGDFAEAAQLPKLQQELADAKAASRKEERPKSSAAVFSGEEDKRTLVLLKLMLQVKKLRDEVADKDEAIYNMQAQRQKTKKHRRLRQ
jgi:hypothetical protein